MRETETTLSHKNVSVISNTQVTLEVRASTSNKHPTTAVPFQTSLDLDNSIISNHSEDEVDRETNPFKNTFIE